MEAIFPRGRFVWHELMTTDPDAAIGFYTKVVGWSTMRWDQDPSYRMWTRAGGDPVGGLMRLPEEARQMGAPPHWLMYVAVPDVEVTVGRARGMGARIQVDVQDVPSVGRFAVLVDPQGAMFAVLTPAGEAPGHDDEPRRGEFSWHELVARDWRAAWEFYHALFGWVQTEAKDMGPVGTYQMFGRAGRTLGGMFNKPPEMTAPPHWLSYIKVASADQAAEAVVRLGGRVLNGPMEVPGGDRITQCMDPQGAAFAVHSAAVVTKPEPAAGREPAPQREAKPRATAAPREKAPAAKRAAARPARKRAAARRPVKKAAPARRPVKKAAPRRRPVKKRAR